MQLARVIGTVVATVKTPGLDGVKLLVIQPLDRHLVPVGSQLVAADAVHMAGPGELVYFVAAREAAEAMPNRFVPVDHAIVGIVDAVRSLTSDDLAKRPASSASSPTTGPTTVELPRAEPPAIELPPAEPPSAHAPPVELPRAELSPAEPPSPTRRARRPRS